MARLKRKRKTSIAENVNNLCTVGGNVSGGSATEIPQKIENRNAYNTVVSLLVAYPKKMKTLMQKDMCFEKHKGIKGSKIHGDIVIA